MARPKGKGVKAVEDFTKVPKAPRQRESDSTSRVACESQPKQSFNRALCASFGNSFWPKVGIMKHAGLLFLPKSVTADCQSAPQEASDFGNG